MSYCNKISMYFTWKMLCTESQCMSMYLYEFKQVYGYAELSWKSQA